MSKRKIYGVIGFSLILIIGVIGFNWQEAVARPSFFSRHQTAVATTTVTYMTPGTATNCY